MFVATANVLDTIPDLAAATKLWRPTNHPADVLARTGLEFLKSGAAQYGLI